MKPIAHIYAKDDGTFDIASQMTPSDTAQLLLSLVSAIMRQMEPGAVVQSRELVEQMNGTPPTLVIRGGEIGPGDRVEGIDGISSGTDAGPVVVIDGEGVDPYRLPRVMADADEHPQG